MDTLMVDRFLDMEGPGTSLPEVVCNLTFHFRCDNGACVNATVFCDGYNDCMDGSDENGCSAPVKRKLTPLEVAAIVLGCIIGTVIVCCLLGTIIDCFMHVYKYWCSCLHKAYKCPSEMIALRTQNNNPNDPTVLVVRAIPPSYSTIIVSCEPSSQVSRSRDNQTQSTDEASGSATCSSPSTAIIPTTDLIPPNSPIRKSLMTDLIPPTSPIRKNMSPGTDETAPLLQHQAVSETSTTTDELVSTKEMSTQTSSSSAASMDSPPIAQVPLALSSVNSRSTPCVFRMRLPPSYSSIFNGEPNITEDPDTNSQSDEVFHSHVTNNDDQSNCNFLDPLGCATTQTTNAEVHASRTPTELMDISVPNSASSDETDQGNAFLLVNGFIKPRNT